MSETKRVAEEMADYVRCEITSILGVGAPGATYQAQRVAVTIAACLRRALPSFNRRRFFAACIENIQGAEDWLEELDSGNIPEITEASRKAEKADPEPVVVEFIAGDGRGGYQIEVAYLTGDMPRDPGGQCAFCHGDPCDETKTQEPIHTYWQNNPRAETCPACGGRAS